MEIKKVLVIAAHPDDEVLGCGGTISRIAQERNAVFIALLGEGITSRFNQRENTDSTLIKSLQESSHKAAKTLGARDVFSFNFPDNRFDTVPLLEIVKTIEELVGKTQPQVIYTHHGGDLNIDHSLTFRATLTACRPMKNCPVKQIYAYEVPSSTEWSFQRLGSIFQPNTFVDITSSLETKIRAMQSYESELRFFPHPRSPEALRIIAQRWGLVIGAQYAEAFELIRSVR